MTIRLDNPQLLAAGCEVAEQKMWGKASANTSSQGQAFNTDPAKKACAATRATLLIDTSRVVRALIVLCEVRTVQPPRN